jgi:hypothetical protein
VAVLIPRILVLGDVLETFSPLLSQDPPLAVLCDDAAAPVVMPRAVVVGVDLRAAGPGREATRLLRERSAAAARVVRTHPSVRHLVIVIVAGPQHEMRRRRAASAAATRRHMEFEREVGRDVEVTVLDVTGCEDAGCFAERLTEHTLDATGVHGVAVLGWSDIRTRSVSEAVHEAYF